MTSAPSSSSAGFGRASALPRPPTDDGPLPPAATPTSAPTAPPVPVPPQAAATSGSLRNASTRIGGFAPAPGGTTAAGDPAAGPVPPPPPLPKPVVQQAQSKKAIVVSPRQRGNPIIKHIKGVPWEYGEIVPDYVVGQHNCVLYLSLRYHRLHPEYLHQRIEGLKGMYSLRIALIFCDIPDHQESIREITKACLINNVTVVVAWSAEEAGQYLASYKLFEHKPADILKERRVDDYPSQLRRALTSVRGVNRTDVLTLSTSFGSFDRMARATAEELAACPGFGDVKVRRLREAFAAPFRGGPPAGAGAQRGLEELGAAGAVKRGSAVRGGGGGGAEGKGKGKERERERSGSPDWPSDGDIDDDGGGGGGAAAGSRAGGGAPREASPDWPDERSSEAEAARRAGLGGTDDALIDVSDLLEEEGVRAATTAAAAVAGREPGGQGVSPPASARRPHPSRIDP